MLLVFRSIYYYVHLLYCREVIGVVTIIHTYAYRFLGYISRLAGRPWKLFRQIFFNSFETVSLRCEKLKFWALHIYFLLKRRYLHTK